MAVETAVVEVMEVEIDELKELLLRWGREPDESELTAFIAATDPQGDEFWSLYSGHIAMAYDAWSGGRRYEREKING